VPLPSDRVQKLRQELAALTGRTVVMTAATDPAIIGGVVAQIGSTVYDGSIRRQLEKMREKLTEGRQ
jgi:F-type H+-transporting ATPase subunit delta